MNHQHVLDMYNLNKSDAVGLSMLLLAIDTLSYLPEYVTIHLSDENAHVYVGETFEIILTLEEMSGLTLGLYAIGYECISGDNEPMIYA